MLPSEKAFAYKMKMDAMKRQGARSDLTSCQNGTKFRADEAMAIQIGESARSIQRYIRLSQKEKERLWSSKYYLREELYDSEKLCQKYRNRVSVK